MSRAQRFVLIAGAVAFALALLFPAWATGDGVTFRVLTRPIWSPPPGAPVDGIARGSMLARFVVIVAATTAAWLALGLRSRLIRARQAGTVATGHANQADGPER